MTAIIRTPNIKPLVAKLQNVVNKIPRLNVELKESTARLESGARDCCRGNDLIEDGESYTEGQYIISGKARAKIWGPPTIRTVVDFKVVKAALVFDAGINVDAEIRFVGQGGSRESQCAGVSCNYGQVGADFRIIPNVSIKLSAYVRIFGRLFGLQDIEVTPASLVIPISGRIGWNSRSSCDGFNGTITIGSVTFRAVFKYCGVGVQYTQRVWDGIRIPF